ncbi:hypothetical protein ACS72_16545 [Acinetobacter sp. VT 511]|uniref:hypothetical protein n=1 Tax=Acinetobacter sp. VT 511 TaxID=1675902 RepID=UPI0006625A42|nr:hypothetical protein [Acinetobacter sp. VT 511]KMU98224.1 hypothetical protein ACS72_16545 [Acinetobacter sp. VT 511]
MTPEMQVIQQLLLYVLFTGFFTGIFFSHRFFDLLEFIYRVYKRRKRKNRASVYEAKEHI